MRAYRTFWSFFTVTFAFCLCGCGQRPGLSEREAALELLARHIAKELKPSAVLVVSNPFAQAKGRPAEIYEFDKAGVRGLQRGFGNDVQIKQVSPDLRAEAISDPASVYIDPRSTTPLSFLVAEDAFQKIVAKNPDCTVVVSLIGLPVNLAAFPAWSKSGPPSFGLLMPDWRIIGGRDAVLAAFASGKLAAAIAHDPEAPAGSQFQLITRQNVTNLMESDPQLFNY